MFTFAGLYLLYHFPYSGLADGTWLEFVFNQFRDQLIMSGRVVSVIVFGLILFILYRFGKRIFGFIPLLIAFAVLALDPFGGRFVAYSRYALPDVTAAFVTNLPT